MLKVGWEVSLVAEVEAWFLDLCEHDPDSADRVAEAVDLLAGTGPALGRPVVDRLKGSRYHDMRELRPGSTGTSEIRLIFAFDPRREAIVLVAGDKSGAWTQWYRAAIPLADDRYTTHLARLAHAEAHGHDAEPAPDKTQKFRPRRRTTKEDR